jgi:spermidine synthase
VSVKIVYTEVDRERTPLGTLVLERYDAEDGQRGYQISIDGSFLMASHGAHSERVMAPLAHERLEVMGGLAPRDPLRVLVGGLGAGHTLAEALRLPGVGRVVVAEIGAKVVEWNRRYFAEANGGAVDDPRVEVRIADLADVVRESDAAYDLMLLDVDNGPGWLAAEKNAGLYEIEGIRDCHRALRPGGVLAVWSPSRNPVFFASLREVFPGVEEVDTLPYARVLGEPADVVYCGVRWAGDLTP